jgi:hypothetical protein
MDDEAKQLLREIRDLLVKAAARDAAWIDEMRPAYAASAKLNSGFMQALVAAGVTAVIAIALRTFGLV